MRFQTLPARDARRLVDEGAQVVDVRERNEFAAGSVPGAINIPLSEFAARFQELETDQPVALLCRSGARSAQAAGFLVERGFTDVSNLDGGLLAA